MPIQLNARIFAALLFCCLGVSAPAQQPATPRDVQRAEGDYIVRDFRFTDGQTLPELRLHYTTLGTPARDSGGQATNAVLVLHGTNRAGTVFLAPSFSD